MHITCFEATQDPYGSLRILKNPSGSLKILEVLIRSLNLFCIPARPCPKRRPQRAASPAKNANGLLRSLGKWPQPPLWQFESEICESPGLGEALNLSLRRSEDLRFSCLFDIQVAMASSQFVMEKLLVSRTSKDGYVGGYN
mgnify:CR=1 FL=1